MSNPVFYAADLSAATFTMSLAENTDYPLVNLFSNLPTLYWKSSANTNAQTLNIDLGSAKACDFIGLGSQNFNSMTTVYLQYDDNDNSSFANAHNACALEAHGTGAIIQGIASVTKRYWRLLFTNTNSITPQCGLLYIGARLTMPFNYDLNAEQGNKQFQTVAVRSLSGILRTSRVMLGVKRFELTFTLIDDATVTAWLTFMDIVQGQFTPFFFADENGTIHVLHFEEDYVPAKGVNANVNDLVTLKMCYQNAA